MQCPTCKKIVPEPAAHEELPKFFPFCSDRCKLIDLGRWLDGKYQIPVQDQASGVSDQDSSDHNP